MSEIKTTFMAKKLASRWLAENMVPEYKMVVYMHGGGSHINLPSIIRTARKRKFKWAQDSYPDLRLKVGFDFVSVRSKNPQAIKDLRSHFAKLGFETFGMEGE